MKKKLTPKLIEHLRPASGKRYEVRDELLTGLLLRVSATGAKVWYLATRIDGRSRRIKLGSWPILSLKDAREKAQMILRDIQLGLFQSREDEPALNPNVYHEIGYLMGLNQGHGLPHQNFLLVHNSSIGDAQKDIRFNLAGIKQLRSSDTNGLREAVKRQISIFFGLDEKAVEP